MIVTDQIYLSDPHSFNDPLDAKPQLEVDLAPSELEPILEQLFKQRMRREMRFAQSVAAKRMDTLLTGDPEALVAELWDSEIGFLHYLAATSDGTSKAGELERSLVYHIEDEILRRYDKGILSLAERCDCPLMWSHYADQHRGLCLGYSVPPEPDLDIRQVEYGGKRLVPASRLKAMLEGNKNAEAAVDQAAFLTKAFDWKYEKEWRLVAPRGESGSYLELEEVIFGLRFPDVLIPPIVKSMFKRDREVKFFRMQETRGTFELRSHELDSGKQRERMAVRYRSYHEGSLDIDL